MATVEDLPISTLIPPSCYVRGSLPLYLAEVSLHRLEFLTEVGPQVH